MPPKNTQKTETKPKAAEPKTVETKNVKPKVVETKTVETKNVKPKVTETKTVETKTTKPVAKVEVKAVNQQTASAGLTLSVTAFKAWMKEYLGQPVKFSGGHIVITAVNETLWRYLIEQTLKEVTKDNAGLYTLTRPAVRNAILLNQDLKYFFGAQFEQFDQDMKYGSQYCIPHKVIAQFINEKCGKNINYDDPTYQLFVFLLLKASSVLTTTAFEMMQYANRKSIDDRAVLAALKLHFNNDLLHVLRMRAEEAVTCAGEAGKEDNDDESSETKSAAKVKSKVEKVDEEVEEGEEDEAGEDDAEEEEVEEEEVEEEEVEEEEVEEEEVKPEPPKKNTGKAVNSSKK